MSPLDRGPDFTFSDGRRLPFTTQSQMERRFKQVELGVRFRILFREKNYFFKEKNSPIFGRITEGRGAASRTGASESNEAG